MSQLCIHRGTKEIGGSCVELQSASGERLIIDLGMPLNDEKPDKKWLPKVEGLAEGDSMIKGILISHAHADHYGLLHFAHESIPVFMSGYQKRVLNEVACHFVPDSKPCLRATEVRAWRWFGVGKSFRVKPILVDHSAFGGFSFLVEIDRKKRVLYSGDFRGHGRVDLLGAFCKKPPENIDVLLMEGTTLNRKTGDVTGSGLEMKFQTEMALEPQFKDAFAKAGDRLCTVMCSGQNISRIAGIASAAHAMGRTFVVDFYTAQVILSTRNPSFIGQFREYMGVYVPYNQRLKIKNMKSPEMFVKVKELDRQRVYLPSRTIKGIRRKYDFSRPELQSKYVFLLNGSVLADLKRESESRKSALTFSRPIFSMWKGYWKLPDKMKWQKKFVSDQGFSEPLFIHTSGHASPTDLRRYVIAASPKWLVPIHTEAPGDYAQLYPIEKIRALEDNEWMDL